MDDIFLNTGDKCLFRAVMGNLVRILKVYDFLK